jgi:integrase
VWLACGDDDYGRIVKLLILTGCRREEIGGVRWSEIDLDKGTLTIPAERAKNGRAHTLPLPAMALDIIRSIPQRPRTRSPIRATVGRLPHMGPQQG